MRTTENRAGGGLSGAAVQQGHTLGEAFLKVIIAAIIAVFLWGGTLYAIQCVVEKMDLREVKVDWWLLLAWYGLIFALMLRLIF